MMISGDSDNSFDGMVGWKPGLSEFMRESEKREMRSNECKQNYWEVFCFKGE